MMDVSLTSQMTGRKADNMRGQPSNNLLCEHAKPMSKCWDAKLLDRLEASEMALNVEMKESTLPCGHPTKLLFITSAEMLFLLISIIIKRLTYRSGENQPLSSKSGPAMLGLTFQRPQTHHKFDFLRRLSRRRCLHEYAP